MIQPWKEGETPQEHYHRMANKLRAEAMGARKSPGHPGESGHSSDEKRKQQNWFKIAVAFAIAVFFGGREIRKKNR